MLHRYLSESQSACPPLSKLPGVPVGLLWGNWNRTRQVQGSLGSFIHLQSVALSLPQEGRPSVLWCFPVFSSALPPYRKHTVPSPVGLTSLQATCLLGIQCWHQVSGVKKSCKELLSLSLFPVGEHFKNNICQLRRVHAKCTIELCNFLISGVLCPMKVIFTVPVFRGASGSASV